MLNGETLPDLSFADDIALLAEEVDHLQKLISRVVEVSSKMGMSINTVKNRNSMPWRGRLQVPHPGRWTATAAN